MSASDAPPISLQFDEKIPDAVRRRLSYAFRVFAAVYGHRVVDPGSSQTTINCHYGGPPNSVGSRRAVRFPARYRIRGKDEPVPLLTAHIHANKTFYLVYGVDDETRNPDWLAEIFEWLSCGHEVGRTARDSIGRFPFSDSVFSRQGISPRQPHAMLMMSWLESLLRCGGSSQGLPKAPSPVPGVEH